MECYSEGADKYYIARIPRKSGKKTFLYYRKYTPNESLKLFDSKRSLYNVFNEHVKRMNSADAHKNPSHTEQTLGKVSLKVFEDPRLATKMDKDTVKKHVDGKIMDNIPEKRTILLLNFDEDLKEKKYRKWFNPIGKIRRVFTGVHRRKIPNPEGGPQKKNMKVFFALIVFKSEKEVEPLFEDPEYLQRKISVLYKDLNLRMSRDAREKYNMELVTKYGKEELDKKKSEFQEKMEEDGFTMVGGAADDFKPQKHPREEENGEFPQKKKKGDIHLDDFYRFQVKNNALKKTLGITNVDLGDETDILKVTKKSLKEDFQKDIEKLKQQKLNKAAKLADDDEDDDEDYEDDGDDLLDDAEGIENDDDEGYDEE